MTSPSTSARPSDLANNWNEQVARIASQSVASTEPTDTPVWLTDIRKSAADAFLLNGLPGNKDEEWKYTSLRQLEKASPRLSELSEVAAGDWQPLLNEPEGFGFRIVDGVLSLDPSELPAGVSIQTLTNALGRDADGVLQSRLQTMLEAVETGARSQAFEALNTAMLDQGIVIHVAQGVDAGTCLTRCAHALSAAGRMTNFRLMIVLEQGARLRLLEQFHGERASTANRSALPANGDALNLLMQAELAENSTLEHIRIVDESEQNILLSFNQINQAGRSNYDYTGFDLGGALVRHDIRCALRGEQAHASVSGAFLLDGERLCDNHVRIDHHAGACTSEQFFRGALGGSGRGVFNGKAVIHPGADGSRVRQSNANLLLSQEAEIDTKPELEIYADEVEASHGATVGQLDEQAIFYMRTRGIPEQEARRQLTGAFCRAVTGRLADRKLAAQLAELLDSHMPQKSVEAGLDALLEEQSS